MLDNLKQVRSVDLRSKYLLRLNREKVTPKITFRAVMVNVYEFYQDLMFQFQSFVSVITDYEFILLQVLQFQVTIFSFTLVLLCLLLSNFSSYLNLMRISFSKMIYPFQNLKVQPL